MTARTDPVGMSLQRIETAIWPVAPVAPHFNRAFADRLQAKWDAEGAAYDRLWPDKDALDAELARIDEQFKDIAS